MGRQIRGAPRVSGAGNIAGSAVPVANTANGRGYIEVQDILDIAATLGGGGGGGDPLLEQRVTETEGRLDNLAQSATRPALVLISSGTAPVVSGADVLTTTQQTDLRSTVWAYPTAPSVTGSQITESGVTFTRLTGATGQTSDYIELTVPDASLTDGQVYRLSVRAKGAFGTSIPNIGIVVREAGGGYPVLAQVNPNLFGDWVNYSLLVLKPVSTLGFAVQITSIAVSENIDIARVKLEPVTAALGSVTVQNLPAGYSIRIGSTTANPTAGTATITNQRGAIMLEIVNGSTVVVCAPALAGDTFAFDNGYFVPPFISAPFPTPGVAWHQIPTGMIATYQNIQRENGSTMLIRGRRAAGGQMDFVSLPNNAPFCLRAGDVLEFGYGAFGAGVDREAGTLS